MHERSLARRLLAEVEAICRSRQAHRVAQVRVEVGPLTGVEPSQLLTAFAELAVGSLAHEANLEIDWVPLSARCRQCAATFSSADVALVCPSCGGRRAALLTGDRLILSSVDLVAADTPCSGQTGEAVA